MTEETRTNFAAGGYAALIPPLLALAVYLPAVTFGAVSLDDPVYLTDNPHVLGGLTLENLRWAFDRSADTYWHPLVWISLMLDAEILPSPAWFHAVNIILHAAGSTLLYAILFRATGLRGAALAVAALFAVHPLNVEAVAWITERKTVLAGLFWMLATYFYVLYAARPGFLRYMAGLAMLGLGLLSKPLLVTLPCALLLLDFWPLKRLRLSPGGRSGMSVPAAVAEKLPMFGLVAVSVYMTMTSHPMETAGQEMPMSLRASNAVVSYVRYLFKAVWPADLAVFYPFPESIPAWQLWGSAAILAVITAAAVILYRRAPYFIVGWLWYLGTMTPMLGLVRHDRWPAVADRFAYVPMIGIFIIAGFALRELYAKPATRRTAAVTALAAILALGIAANRQLGYWSDSEALYRRALEVTDGNWMAHNNLGNLLYNKGQTDEAVYHYRQTLKFRPGYPRALVDLGFWRLQQGDYPAAEAYFRRALGGIADGAAWQGLARLALERGDVDAALIRFHKAVRENPRLLNSWQGMAESMEMLGMHDEAARAYVRAAQRHLDTFRLSKARELAESALAMDPDNEKALELRRRAGEKLRETDD